MNPTNTKSAIVLIRTGLDLLEQAIAEPSLTPGPKKPRAVHQKKNSPSYRKKATYGEWKLIFKRMEAGQGADELSEETNLSPKAIAHAHRFVNDGTYAGWFGEETKKLLQRAWRGRDS